MIGEDDVRSGGENPRRSGTVRGTGGTEERGEIEDGANEPQQEQRPASVRQEYHLTFSEEETERWEDAEEEEGSGEHGEEQPEWDFTDLRRRSSNFSSYIRGFRAAQQQVGARHAMAAQIKFQSLPTFGGKEGSGCIDTKESGDIIDGEMKNFATTWSCRFPGQRRSGTHTKRPRNN
ncbi:hypothetical protein OUZ56_025482 [Daphnia magna]|uniref:Uncharacterized protein n=1 Tax=Daphnia magna TaxID=35525 RepID=A0ABQ9ZK00_9CRUS|nr:hypothetical protein OUZ56_025482 [Daphnia magna]